MDRVEDLSWGTALARGLIAIVFGIILLAWPKATIGAVILVFGIWAIAGGLAGAIVAIVKRADRKHWFWSVIGGLVSMAIGIAVLVWPKPSALLVLYLIGAVALVWGLSDIFMSIGIRRSASAWSVVLLALAGIVSVAFGFYVLVHPGEGAVAIIWLVATYEIVWGVLLSTFAIAMRMTGGGGGGRHVAA